MAKTVSVTAVQRAFYKELHMEPRCQISIYSQCNLFEEEGCVVKPRVLVHVPCLVYVWTVFVLIAGTNHKNQLAEVVSCEIVPKKHVAQLLQPLSLPIVEQTIMSCGSNFQNKWNLTTATPSHYDPDYFKQNLWEFLYWRLQMWSSQYAIFSFSVILKVYFFSDTLYEWNKNTRSKHFCEKTLSLQWKYFCSLM